MNSPTEKSLEKLRKAGYFVGITEHFNGFARIRQDLFGFIDMVAITPDAVGVLAVQTTSRTNMNARIEKILVSKYALPWLQSGNRIEAHGWIKRGKTGTRKLWECDVREITLDDFRNL